MRGCRLLITVSGLLLAGAAMNVVVALAIGAFGPKPPVAYRGYVVVLGLPYRPGRPLINLGSREGDCRTPPWHYEPDAKLVSTLPTGLGHWQAWGHGGVTYAFGWPRPTLRCAELAGGESAQALHIPGLTKSLGLFEKTDGAVPIGPLPAGILRNSTLYAAIFAAALGLFPLRRQIRSRRGLCAKCCYDLAGVEADCCPECGTPNYALRAAPRPSIAR